MEIKAGSRNILAVTFTASGEYLVSGGFDGVQVWRVSDGSRKAAMGIGCVRCLAVSRDDSWIAAGTLRGKVMMWDGGTYEPGPTLQMDAGNINGIDFSPVDSTRLVAASDSNIAAIWDLATRRHLLALDHGEHQQVIAAKYSPQGDRVATATHHFVRVWDSHDGRLLMNIQEKPTPWLNTGLLWSSQQLIFVVSDGKIKHIHASTGSLASEWPVPEDSSYPCIALSEHGNSVAYSHKRIVTVWDTATHIQLDLIQHPRNIRSIAFSPRDQSLAFGGDGGLITIKRHFVLSAPDILIDDIALDSWIHDELVNAEAFLTAAIPKSHTSRSLVLASRALVRTRLRNWDAAIDDAKQSIKLLPSMVGFIAQSVAFAGAGKGRAAYRACDVAFEHAHSTHIRFLLLIKAIVVFMAGEHKDAISRMDDLIATAPLNSPCHVVQAYMHLLLGNSHMEKNDYEGAILSFKRALAQVPVRPQGGQPLLVVSLISGWKFDSIYTTIQQRLCEAFYASGRMQEAGEFLLKAINTTSEEDQVNGPIATWISDLLHSCLFAPERNGDTTFKTPRNPDATLFTPSHSSLLTPLLRKWAKLKLTNNSWKDILIATGFMIPRYPIYLVICERLETTDRVIEAVECFQQMVSELVGEIDVPDERAKWVTDFKRCCTEKLTRFGDAAADAQQYDDAITQYSIVLSLGPAVPQEIFIKRSRVYAAREDWENAGHDIIEAIAANLARPSWKNALATADSFHVPRFEIYRALCERLEAVHRMSEATECFHQMTNDLAGETDPSDRQMQWGIDFKQRCGKRIEHLGDAAADAQLHDDAIAQYSAALSLDPTDTRGILIKRSKAYVEVRLWEDALDDASQVTTFDTSSAYNCEWVLVEWARVVSTDVSWRNALETADRFKVSRFAVYCALCVHLEAADRVVDAVECLHDMSSKLAQEPESQQAKWALAFGIRCCAKLEQHGDNAMTSRKYDEAICQFSSALSLSPASQDLLVKRSRAHVEKGSWDDALLDANEVITLDPSSPFGYERKYTALRGAGRLASTLKVFNVMLSKMLESSDLAINERYFQYMKTRKAIHGVVQDAIRDLPRVLIDTASGRLFDKSKQAAAFELSPIFTKLMSSMTTHIDRGRIKTGVAEYYRYAMLSHKWEDDEPLFGKVIHIAVYELEESPTHEKLQMFCKLIRDAGFNWAWSDTCCIDKSDHFVLQEALVAMFKWYEGSAVTIVFLRGVRSPSKRGDLMRSIWNTRAWTFQEYHAAKVVRFYTEDWTPYMNLDCSNHKESSDIISEMEEATGVSARALRALKPGLENIREKLRLASTRQTTLIEDAAYSLLGIFSVAGISAIYGERESALGRLLAHVISGSGDVSILAWTGESGKFNSCLPAYITVFNGPPTSHLPPTIEDSNLERVVTALRKSSHDLNSALKLYDRLDGLPTPWFAASRMKLPCIAFKLPSLTGYRTSTGRVYRAETPALGRVEITTREDPSQLKSQALYLVHPWLDTLLDDGDAEHESTSGDVSEGDVDQYTYSPDASEDENVDDEEIENYSSSPPARNVRRASTDTMAVFDRETRALRLVARLRQPFGALLLMVVPTRRRTVYKRVAADSMITVRIREDVSLTTLLGNVRVLDVL